ncbi:MAG: hypothetical protein KatS3mg076_0214 [Candidatus Binatia bacterium]|nr:MAG: hypothetical protein KatS3mg076_0214 [Candidatus Binatia bacterium]
MRSNLWTNLLLLLCVSGWVPSVEAGEKEKNAVLHLVPAREPALATLLLTARGLEEPVLLFESRDQAALEQGIAGWKGERRCYHTVETSPTTVHGLEKLAGGRCTVVTDFLAFSKELWPRPARAVFVRAESYPGLLYGATLARALGAALVPLPREQRTVSAELLSPWALEKALLGPRIEWAGEKGRTELVSWRNVSEYFRLLPRREYPLAVIASPRDHEGLFSPSHLSLLAPLWAAHHGAPLYLVRSGRADEIEREVADWWARHDLAPRYLLLVGDEIALPTHRIPDPVLEAGGPEARGGGTVVRVELFSELEKGKPADLVVGRFVAETAPLASLAVARHFHFPRPRVKKPVVFLANADEIFALGETISRTTVAELRNVSIPVRLFTRQEVDRERIEAALADTEVLVWEGHPRDLTLEERGGVAVDRTPEFVFLQGCYTLDRSDPFILLEKGTRAIVASSAAIYSASGSAFARALFDGLVHERLDLGTAVRNARNYLFALAELKKRRGHPDWTKTLRAALAFALWGDPTYRPPLEPRSPSVPPASWRREGDRLVLEIPGPRLPPVRVGRYRARPVPRAMLGGLLLKGGDETARELKEVFFAALAEVGDVRVACPPAEGWDVVSYYAPRTATLYVLARPDWRKLSAAPRGRFAFPLARRKEDCPELGGQPPRDVNPPPTTAPRR